ncbi:MAG: TldD/PmbA family protein [Candidatus Heimdallarchaeota archaeon]|nr:TldD/PmbA family protein [Candidatus Heimdallarchaeota archaeon]
MKDRLNKIIDERPDGVHVEARFHHRKKIETRADKGKLQRATVDEYGGVGIRVLVDGAWGFASTSKLDKKNLEKTLNMAVTAAKSLAPSMKEKITLAPIKPITGTFKSVGKDPLADHSIEERINLIMNTDKQLREADEKIKGTFVYLREYQNHKIILNSDGSEVEIFDSTPDFYVRAVAHEAGKIMPYMAAKGICGGWELFEISPPEKMVDEAVEKSIKLLDAPLAKGGKNKVVMSPGVVGIICHEAIGHTVESDFVLSGSVAKGKIGKTVASEHVTLIDSGEQKNGSGWVPVDDAGVEVKPTVIIKDGIMKSYLHSRFTAKYYDVKPTGNERAFEYDNEPLIRMRNTYLEPGDFTKEELIEAIDFGYYLVKPGGGQADSSAEFMFGITEAYEIKKGQIGQMVKNVTITGNAFEVLQSVDGVGKDWQLDMGNGHCGKGQLMKVDGGGGSTRAFALVSGDIGGK